jgi:glutamyl-tRNA reductase
MRLVAVGLSHRSAELDLRGTVAFDEARRRCLLANLKAAGAAEAAVIATCNRTEIYVAGPDPATVDALARTELSDVAGADAARLDPALYHLRDDVAALHLCRVTAGLDSLVPGEVEILGQVREALAVAEEEGTIGPLLYRAFQSALEAGKRARSETGIAEQNASVASVAAELARTSLGGLEGRSALLIGAGHTSELAALNLMGRGLRDVTVSTRTFASACTLAERLGGSAVRFEEVHERLPAADLVVASTSAPHAVLAADVVRRAVAGRTRDPLLLIDLAVPRDIEPEVRWIEGCVLHDLDDLQAVVARNVALRQQEAAAAEEICAAQAEQFREWQAARVVVPSIVRLRERGEAVAAEEVARAAAGWPELDDGERARLDRLGRAIARRLLHEPTVRLREGAAASDGVAYAETVRDLFGLELPNGTPAPDA